ncbi:C6 transcription factor [Lasiodiplodia theobromae]|uniref:Cutinase transcription factor 1 beta n=1 Tax=Lasiodiplodia theobromae TaxID=45133 RepID=A0A5N5CWA3_9PEZI|nr:C6 transcription factor [Lasiodiplodia theobromae]KAB2569611.1 Cutinase transcription factor 1 beta [Lasiodiplodia theobromae]KAF4535827.1 C6 transcription factor [Lasiodiplodia theobromae]
MSASPASNTDTGELLAPLPPPPKPTQQNPAQQQAKRKASAAGMDNHGTGRSVKRRASKACQCCRARKVRCNVTEHGAPCTNCRLDEVECIVSESRRKKKWSRDDDASKTTNDADVATAANGSGKRRLASRDALDGLSSLKNGASSSVDLSTDEHVPHSIYASHGQRLNYSFSELNRRMSTASSTGTGFPILGYSPVSTDAKLQQPFFANIAPKANAVFSLPAYIKPLPSRIGPDEIAYLQKKGALTIPTLELKTELLRAYVEFVHPYMPLLDLHEFLRIIDCQDGSQGKMSLILFQAVMFAGSAFADFKYLRKAGYSNRKEARKDFFQKTRLLYDFDYEQDRVSLVQALLLLTYYYETPDDQKDTWHWMGVATSVAHTIGLHRNPDKANMDPRRIKLWKRIWWSTYMRDRLIALGMRRPTRIKDEDYDVPLLTLDDFEIAAVPDSISCIPADCVVARDVALQRQLAVCCIQKAKLCLCISHVLSKQYCVLNNNQGLLNDRTTMMLLPKKLDPQKSDVKHCDAELKKWKDELPDEAKYEEASSGNRSIDLHKSLLHMVFYTTLSALHRPQVLPSAPVNGCPEQDANGVLESSRRHVRTAATAITGIAQKLDSLDLVRFLPTTGVTVLLPAIIIHLLDIKSPDEETRRSSLRGFCQCMQVMGKLRDLYAAADYSTAFLEAAIRKAGISIAPIPPPPAPPASVQTAPTKQQQQAEATGVDDLLDAGHRMDTSGNVAPYNTITPPPDSLVEDGANGRSGVSDPNNTSDEEVARRLETFLASTPPASDHHASDASQPDVDGVNNNLNGHNDACGAEHGSVDMSGASDSNQMFPWPNFTLDDGSGDTNSFCGKIDGLTGFESGAGAGTLEDGGLAVDFDALMNTDAMGDACASFSFNDFGTNDEGEHGNGLSGFGGEGLDVGVASVDWMKGMA